MDITKANVTLQKWPGNWSPVTEKTMTFIEAVHWFRKHGYTLSRAWESERHGRVMRFEKPDCKTRYEMWLK